MFYFVFFLKFWLPIGLRSGCCCNNFNNVPTVAAVSAQRPVEHFKKALQNITTDRTPHSVSLTLTPTTLSHREVFLVVVDDVLGLGVVEAELAVHRLEADTARVEHVLQPLGVLLTFLELRQYRPGRGRMRGSLLIEYCDLG